MPETMTPRDSSTSALLFSGLMVLVAPVHYPSPLSNAVLVTAAEARVRLMGATHGDTFTMPAG